MFTVLIMLEYGCNKHNGKLHVVLNQKPRRKPITVSLHVQSTECD